MPPIKGMLVQLFTHEADESGTDDQLYIGFWGTGGGREFPLSVEGHSFETGSQVTYILGGEPAPTPTVAERPDRSKPGQDNDPGRIPVDLASVQYVYIRKQAYGEGLDDLSDDAYKAKFVTVFLYGLPGAGSRQFTLDTAGKGLWLGNEHGHQAWLSETRG